MEETAHAIIKSKGYPKKVEGSLIRVADAFLHTTFSNADVASAHESPGGETFVHVGNLVRGKDPCEGMLREDRQKLF